jgi:superfamily I DNA and/or RNA helicase
MLKSLHPSKKVLACAPSDAAADVICQRLTNYFSNKQLLRLNWWQRLPDSVPINIRNYTTSFSSESFDLPDLTKLKTYDIIVATCGAAGSLRYSFLRSSALAAHKSSTVIKEAAFSKIVDESSICDPQQLLMSTVPLLFDVVIIDEASQGTEAEVIIYHYINF